MLNRLEHEMQWHKRIPLILILPAVPVVEVLLVEKEAAPGAKVAPPHLFAVYQKPRHVLVHLGGGDEGDELCYFDELVTSMQRL